MLQNLNYLGWIVWPEKRAISRSEIQKKRFQPPKILFIEICMSVIEYMALRYTQVHLDTCDTIWLVHVQMYMLLESTSMAISWTSEVLWQMWQMYTSKGKVKLLQTRTHLLIVLLCVFGQAKKKNPFWK